MSKSFKQNGDRFENEFRRAKRDARNSRRHRQAKHWAHVDVRQNEREDLFSTADYRLNY